MTDGQCWLPLLLLLLHPSTCSMWGRILGLAFAVPCTYFAVRGYITRPLARRLGLLFFMGGTQGLVGWWMVRSGLQVRMGGTGFGEGGRPFRQGWDPGGGFPGTTGGSPLCLYVSVVRQPQGLQAPWCSTAGHRSFISAQVV